MAKQVKKTVNKKKPRNIITAVIAIIIIIGFILLMILPSLTTTTEVNETRYNFTKQGELIFTDSLGREKAKIDIEIADTEYKRQLGLMYRKEMEENQGMLFIFPREDFQSFWMQNTFISLDMLFINSRREIVTIHKNTTPYSQQSYPSTAPAQYVVEVIAGYTSKHNIREGDRINWMATKLEIRNP
jgi:uncharacterized protein